MIEKVNCNLDIIELEDKEGITLNSHKHNVKITILDDDKIENVIADKFNKKYRSLLYLIMSLNSDDTTDSDAFLALDKINNLENILKNKYAKFLNPNLLQRYFNMLVLLKDKIDTPKLEEHHRLH